MKPVLSVVIPCYNEEESITETIESVKSELKAIKESFEIIVINDGSTDSTPKILQKLEGIRVVNHEKNIGYGAALKTGLRYAIGDYILITDADQSYPAREIPKLIKYMRDYDMVVGARSAKSRGISLVRKLGKFTISKTANLLVGEKIPDINSGLRVFRKDMAMKFYSLYPNGFSFTITITLAAITNGFSVKYVPIEYHKRRGKSKINIFRDGFNFLTLMIRMVTYFNPLKVFFSAGILLFLIALFVFLYSFFFMERILDTTVTILAVSSVQVCLFGLLADLIVKHSERFV